MYNIGTALRINFVFQEQPDLQTFRTVFHYCFVIIVVPVASFFVAKSIVFDGKIEAL
jgi:hypothetical protein